jgi:Skp family chaperone for outer membrane proteins
VVIQRATVECAQGRKARTALKEVFNQYQEQLNEEQAAAKKAIEDLKRERAGLPADVVRQREAELQAWVGRIQAMYQRDQKDMHSREEAVMGPLANRIRRISAQMESARNLTVIFDKPSADALHCPDITGEMIHCLDAGE